MSYAETTAEAMPQGFAISIPEARSFGFLLNKSGGHMARSMMLAEIKVAHAVVPSGAGQDEFRKAIVERNILGKTTQSSRDKSFRHLLELYGLDDSLPLFRVMRRLAGEADADFPLIAMLCVYGRDPQLRQSFGLLETLDAGAILPRQQMEDHLEAGFPGRFSAATKKSLAQNVNTTWTYSGHLEGRVKKIRALPRAGWTAATYAMFVGYLMGLRGENLINSVFSRLVACTPAQLTDHLSQAAARHWLRLRKAGGVIEIDFSELAQR